MIFGRQDSKPTFNTQPIHQMLPWVRIASKLPQNKSDPHFAPRTILHLRNNLLDFHLFCKDTAMQVKILSEESKKALRACLMDINVSMSMDEIEFAAGMRE